MERIFTDIMQACAPEQLTVYARYTRRGGLDINPVSYTHLDVYKRQASSWARTAWAMCGWL